MIMRVYLAASYVVTMLRNGWNVLAVVRTEQGECTVAGERFRWRMEVRFKPGGDAISVFANVDEQRAIVLTGSTRKILRLSNYDLQVLWDAPGNAYIDLAEYFKEDK